MQTVFRKYAAVLLILAYAFMLLGQIAPMAMGSATIAHAITGECSGDCGIDGCSLESRANHTCCCWHKKQQRAAMTQTAKLDHGNMKSTALPAPKKVCCPTTSLQPPDSASPSCKNNRHVHDEVTADKPAEHNTHDSQPVYKCGCPCGDNKQLALWGLGKIEWVPSTLPKINIVIYEEQYHLFDPARLTSRHGDPPDPPPKIALPA